MRVSIFFLLLIFFLGSCGDLPGKEAGEEGMLA